MDECMLHVCVGVCTIVAKAVVHVCVCVCVCSPWIIEQCVCFG